MNYTPPQQNKYVTAIVVSLIVFGIGVYMLPAVVHIRAIFCQVIALVCLVAAVFLLTRYKTTSFTYIIRTRSLMQDDKSDDSMAKEAAYAAGMLSIDGIAPKYLDFVVSKTQGTRSNMECVLGLDSLMCAVPCGSTGDTKDKPYNTVLAHVREQYPNVALYDYTVTLGVTKSLLLVFRDGEQYAACRIEPNAAMQSYLIRIAGGGGTSTLS